MECRPSVIDNRNLISVTILLILVCNLWFYVFINWCRFYSCVLLSLCFSPVWALEAVRIWLFLILDRRSEEAAKLGFSFCVNLCRTSLWVLLCVKVYWQTRSVSMHLTCPIHASGSYLTVLSMPSGSRTWTPRSTTTKRSLVLQLYIGYILGTLLLNPFHTGKFLSRACFESLKLCDCLCVHFA